MRKVESYDKGKSWQGKFRIPRYSYSSLISKFFSVSPCLRGEHLPFFFVLVLGRAVGTLRRSTA